jgi:hypothetical protein
MVDFLYDASKQNDKTYKRNILLILKRFNNDPEESMPLRACFGMVRHEGASLLAVVYSITGIDVIKASPNLHPKGLGGQ